MSRTDKDAPWWVNAPGVEPLHNHRFTARGCNLPPQPDAGTVIRPAQRHYRRDDPCIWYPVYPYRNWGPGAPRWFIEHVDTAPTRVKVRDSCIKARKEYRGSGEIDAEPPTNQHRHCAAWLYW